jgi:hypothetical protein
MCIETEISKCYKCVCSSIRKQLDAQDIREFMEDMTLPKVREQNPL